VAVTSLVLEAGGDEDAAIAAVLHDAAEDQELPCTLARITDVFGAHVGAIVDACSETIEYPRRPAIERKGRYIERLDDDATVRDVLLVTMADKLDGLRTVLTDYRAVGPVLWDRFNLGPTDQLWYYRALADVYRRRLGGPMSMELDQLLLELAGVPAAPSELTWARVGVLPGRSVVGLGDPAAINRPETVEPSRQAWMQLAPDSALGLVCAYAEAGELAVQIGLAGSRAVAARIEFVTDIDELQATGKCDWKDLGEFACERVASIDVQQPRVTGCRIEVPLPAGRYRASVYCDGEGDTVGVVLRAVRN
jgi:hypothetical protein